MNTPEDRWMEEAATVCGCDMCASGMGCRIAERIARALSTCHQEAKANERERCVRVIHKRKDFGGIARAILINALRRPPATQKGEGTTRPPGGSDAKG